MKETNWNDCLINKSAKTITPDINRAESLTETAKERISLIKEITEKNCNFVFEDYYTSLLELLQAMAFKKGYNILNHICLGFYLRDVLNREDLYILFDDLRFKRNSLTYYGSRMDFETARQAIEKSRKLLNEFRKILKEEAA
ncbi:hypothetical protein J4471_04970 [Candidatus Woesearchaeota archaeon]|nr:hypothetical protein [Candidatus Woesearchaeota archaeon]